jgi:hypothetical protein
MPRPQDVRRAMLFMIVLLLCGRTLTVAPSAVQYVTLSRMQSSMAAEVQCGHIVILERSDPVGIHFIDSFFLLLVKMKSNFMVNRGVVAALLFAQAYAQQSAYGQCGGISYSGVTTCVSGKQDCTCGPLETISDSIRLLLQQDQRLLLTMRSWDCFHQRQGLHKNYSLFHTASH